MAELIGAASGAQAAYESMRGMAQTRLLGAEADKQQMEVQQQRNFMQQMANMSPQAQSLDMPGRIDSMANVALRSGLINQAANLSEKAALVRSHMAQLAHTQMTMQNQQVEQGKKTIDLMGQFLQGATDQASWDRGNTMFTMMTGKQSPYANIPYNPKLVGELQAQSMTAKDAADLALHQTNQNSLDATRQSAIDFRLQRADIMDREQTLREGRDARVAKAGGKAIGAPAKGEVDAATSMVMGQYTNLPAEEVTSTAYTVASRARALRQANPGLDADTSMHQAMQEMNIQNPPSILDRMYGIFKATDATGAGSPMKPLPLPADRKLLPGHFYQTPRGVAKWNGNSFEALPSGSSLDNTTDEEDTTAGSEM